MQVGHDRRRCTSSGSMPRARSCAGIACSGFISIVVEAAEHAAQVLLRVDRHRGVEAGVDEDRPDAGVLDQERDDRHASIQPVVRAAAHVRSAASRPAGHRHELGRRVHRRRRPADAGRPSRPRARRAGARSRRLGSASAIGARRRRGASDRTLLIDFATVSSRWLRIVLWKVARPSVLVALLLLLQLDVHADRVADLRRQEEAHLLHPVEGDDRARAASARGRPRRRAPASRARSARRTSSSTPTRRRRAADTCPT